MKTQKEIKRKIKAVVNIQKVTKAMETMASIKLQKASRLAISARKYSDELYSFVLQIVKSLAFEELCSLLFCRKSKSLPAGRQGKNVLFVVFSPDKGLCGSLSGRLMHKFIEVTDEEKKLGKNVKVIAIGKKGAEFLKKRNFDIISTYTSLSNTTSRDIAIKVVEDCVKAFDSQVVDEVYLFYNHFISAVRYDITAVKLLPLSFETEKPLEHIPQKTMPIFGNGYPDTKYSLPPLKFEPGLTTVVENIFKDYIETMVMQSLLESIASENAARMIAMQQATINADDMIADLNLLYNKARQMIITRDIIEIVSSAAALS